MISKSLNIEGSENTVTAKHRMPTTGTVGKMTFIKVIIKVSKSNTNINERK